MLDPVLLKQIRKIQIIAKNLVSSELMGNYQAAFKGQGLDFEEVREYVPGDDVRRIDWNVTARMQTPYVKIFREQKELTIYLFVDISASTRAEFGSRTRQKTSAEFAALIAYLAKFNQDKVGLILFSDQVELHIPPGSGRGHIWKMIKSTVDTKPKSKGTNLNAALEHFLKIQKRRTMVFVISDFVDVSFGKTLRVMSAKHDVVGIGVEDHRDQEIPNVGMVDLVDSETGEQFSVNTSQQDFRDVYQKQATSKRSQLEKSFFQRGAHFIWHGPKDSTVQTIRDLMKKRTGRLSR